MPIINFKFTPFVCFLVVLIVGGILTTVATFQAGKWQQQNLSEKLEHESSHFAAHLQTELDLQQEALLGLVGLFVASDDVSRKEFRSYVTQLDLAHRFPAIYDFRYAKRVPAENLASWQNRVTQSLLEMDLPAVDVAVKPTDVGSEYLLLEYIWPFDGKRLAINLFARPHTKEALARLQQGADFALSERITDTYAVPTYTLLARLPTKGSDPFPGTVSIIFQPARLVAAVIQQKELGLDVELYDQPTTKGIAPLFDSNMDHNASNAGQKENFQALQTLRVGDAKWTLVVTALPDWKLAREYHLVIYAVGLIGLLGTLLLAGLVYFLVARRQEAEVQATQSKSMLLRAQKVAKVGSWHLDFKSGQLSWTPEVYRMFGVASDTSLSYELFFTCVHLDDRELVDAAWQAALKGAPYKIDHRIRVRGETCWVHEQAEFVFDADGQPMEALGTVLDISERQRAAEALGSLNAELELRVAERTAQLSAVLDHLVDTVIGINQQGIIQSANPALERVLGYTPDEVIGQNVAMLMPEPHKSSHDNYIERYLSTGETHIIDTGREIEARHKSGELIPMDLSVSEYQIGEKHYFVGVLHDIRKHKKLLKEKEVLLRERQEFLATMSHEIRTPLTGLLGMLELISLSPLSSEQLRDLTIARESGKALSRIIDEILDYSKIEAGKLVILPQPEAMQILIETVRDAYLGVASTKNLLLTSFVDPQLPQSVLMDGMRVRQILNNFVSNALKFTSKGYVELRAEWLGGDDKNVTVRFAVRDTGIGIAPEVQRNLFGRYAQADITFARRYGGTGLGLAICKRLTELMNGDIGAHSTLNMGSTFYATFNFPVTDVVAVSQPIAGEVLCQLDTGGKPILVADDHPTNRALIERQLTLLGLPMELVENGSQALAKWRYGDYALIITDVHMPVMDGLELTQAVRAIEAREGRRHGIPILAWTAAAMNDEMTRCYAAGIDGVLIKPTELALLRQTLLRWLPSINLTEQSEEKVAVPKTEVDETLPVWDVAVLTDLVGDMPALHQEIIASFFENAQGNLTEIRSAYNKRDAWQLARSAHKFKSAARTIGAKEMAATLADLESAGNNTDWTAAEIVYAHLDKIWQNLVQYFDRSDL